MKGGSFSFIIKNVYSFEVQIIQAPPVNSRNLISMLISHKHKFIFIHIAKTGGSSISSALMPYCKPRIQETAHRYLSLLNIHVLQPMPYEGHISARKLADKMGRDMFKEYFSFSFVRNPWDWQVSMYHFMLSRPKHPTHQTIKELGNFKNYIKWRSEMGMVSQKTILSDADGSLLVDHIGRFENLHDDYEAICHKIGVPVRKLPHKKYIKKKPYQYYYTPKLRDMVASFSKEDIDTFGYSFED